MNGQNHGRSLAAHRWGGALFAVGLLALSPCALAAPTAWKASEASCLTAFDAPDQAEEGKLLNCADDFAADAVVIKIEAKERIIIEKGLRHLYDNGSDKGAKVARIALQRLGINLPVRAPKASASASSEPQRVKYDPPDAKREDKDAAEKLYKDGVSRLKKKKYKDGVALLQKAQEKYPRSEKILFNLACGEAKVGDSEKACFLHLQNLADLGTDYAAELLIKARTDLDFEDLRENTEFKRITGYLRAQVINTVGDPGDPGVENIMKLFDKLSYRKPDKRDDESTPLPAPVVQFKPHSKAQVGVIAELLGDPETKLEPMTFDSKYDVIIRWGTRLDEAGKPLNLGPETADEAIANARRKQNKALAQPEQAIGKVNKVLDSPSRAISEAGKMKDRVLGVGDKAKGVVDKAKDLEKIGDKAKDAMKIKGL